MSCTLQFHEDQHSLWGKATTWVTNSATDRRCVCWALKLHAHCSQWSGALKLHEHCSQWSGALLAESQAECKTQIRHVHERCLPASKASAASGGGAPAWLAMPSTAAAAQHTKEIIRVHGFAGSKLRSAAQQTVIMVHNAPVLCCSLW